MITKKSSLNAFLSESLTFFNRSKSFWGMCYIWGVINISKNYISLNSNLILFVICNVELKKSSRIKDQ